MSRARQTLQMWNKAIHTGAQMDVLNAMEFLVATGTKCNYEATLQGIVLSHHFGNWV